MGGTIVEQKEEKRICPYLDIECRAVCPGWIAPIEDCLFHVCLTQVKECFIEGARYLDEHLGLADGVGMDTLTGLRAVVNGTATEEQREIVRSVLGSLIQGGVLAKLSTMTVQDIAVLVGKAESKISFAFGKLFGTDDPDDPEIR